MSDDRPPETGAENPDAGVFGNLPGSRPGKRSPRRDSAGAGATRAARAKPADTASKRPAGPAPEASAPPPPAAAEPTGEPAAGGGLEDIAWAGVAAAAE